MSASIASTSPPSRSAKVASARRSRAIPAQHPVGEAVELLPKLVVGQPVAGCATRVIDPGVHRLTVVGERGRPGLGVWDVGIGKDLDARHQVANIRAHDGSVRELGLTRAAVQQRDGTGERHRELALQTGTGIGLSGQLEHQRVHAQPDLLDALRGDSATDGEVAHRVDGGMDHHAARVRLHSVVEDLPPLPEPVDQVGWRARRRHHRKHSAAALQRVRRARESSCRKQPCPDARRSRVAGVERFGHGAELLAVAGRLCRGDAEAMRGGCSGQAEQPDRNGRRSEGAGGAGHMPAGVVVLGVEGVTRPCGEFVAKRVRGEQIDTAGATPFGQRRSRGVQRRRRVKDRRHVRVIEIKCMARDSVDQCRVGDAQPVRGAEHHGLRVTAQCEALLPGYSCGGFFGTRDSEAEVIQQAPSALVQHLGGDVGGGGVTHEVEQRSRLDGGPIVVASRVCRRLPSLPSL